MVPTSRGVPQTASGAKGKVGRETTFSSKLHLRRARNMIRYAQLKVGLLLDNVYFDVLAGR